MLLEPVLTAHTHAAGQRDDDVNDGEDDEIPASAALANVELAKTILHRFYFINTLLSIN